MALKIPDSPNIIGGQTVLRQPSSLHGTTVTPDLRVDTSATQDFVAKVGQAVADYRDEKNKVLFTQVQNSYLQQMTNKMDDIFASHTGKDAQDLYPLLKDASTKIANDLMGVGKKDGQVRIANKDIQKQFMQWVAEQQPTYISKAATYGASEWSKYEEEVNSTNEDLLVAQIVNADSDATMQNAINGLMANSQKRFGLDPRRAAIYAAAKVDSAVSMRIMRDIPTDPIGAMDKLMNNPIAVESLTSETKKTLHDEIIKSYEKLAAQKYAEYQETGGPAGANILISDANLKQLYQTDNDFEIEQHRTEIVSEGIKLAEAHKKETAGAYARQLRSMQSAILYAPSMEEKLLRIQELRQFDPDAADTIESALTDYTAMQNIAGQVRAMDAEYAGIERFEEETEKFERQMIQKEIYKRLQWQAKDSGKALELKINTEKLPTKKELLAVNKSLPEEYRLSEEDLGKLTAQSKVSATQQMLLTDQDAAMFMMYDSYMNQRVSQETLNKYIDLSKEIGLNNQFALDATALRGLPSDFQMQLFVQQEVQNKYINLSDKLKNTYGIDLDSKLSNAVTQYNNYSLASQNMMKRNIVSRVEAFMSKYGAPSDTQLNSIIAGVVSDSVSPEDAKFQQALAETPRRTLDALNIDANISPAVAREALDEYKMLTPEQQMFRTQTLKKYSSLSDKTSEKERKWAGTILDNYADKLTTAQKDIIEKYKDQLVPLVLAGEGNLIATIVQIQM